MKTIKLPETDYAGMRRFYQEELDKTLKRLQHIQSVLAQLGDTSVVIDKTILNVTAPDASPYIGETEKNEPVAPKRKYRKKAGRKALWGPIILKRMKQLNRPLTYDELTDEIMTFSNLPEEKREATKQAVINVTFRLRTKENKIDTFSNGSRIKYLALKQWFDENGEISEVYRRMLPQPSLAESRRLEAKRRAAEIAKDPSKAAKYEAEKPRRGRPPKPISSVWADPSKRPVKKKRKPIDPNTPASERPKRGRPRKDASVAAQAAPAAKEVAKAEEPTEKAKAPKANSASAKAAATRGKTTKAVKAVKADLAAKAKTPAPTKPISKLNKTIKKDAEKPAAKRGRPPKKK